MTRCAGNIGIEFVADEYMSRTQMSGILNVTNANECHIDDSLNW